MRENFLQNYHDPIPTTLLYPIFGQFDGDIKNVELTEEDDCLALDPAHAMSAFYSSDDKVSFGMFTPNPA